MKRERARVTMIMIVVICCTISMFAAAESGGRLQYPPDGKALRESDFESTEIVPESGERVRIKLCMKYYATGEENRMTEWPDGCIPLADAYEIATKQIMEMYDVNEAAIREYSLCEAFFPSAEPFGTHFWQLIFYPELGMNDFIEIYVDALTGEVLDAGIQVERYGLITKLYGRYGIK